jgi:hypothetical protein
MKYTVNQAAEKLGLSVPNIYKKIRKNKKRIQSYLVKNPQGHMLLREEALEIIRLDNPNYSMNNQCEQELFTENSSDKERIINILESNVNQLNSIIREKDNQINEMINGQNRHDTIIMTLTQQIQNQSKQLEDLRKKPEVVQPKVNKVSSIRRKAESVETGGGEVETSHPKENWGLFMQAWVKMFQPWKMRRDYKGKKAA